MIARGADVDDQRDREQHETGGDQRAAAGGVGLAELVRDVGGDRVAAVLDEVCGEMVNVVPSVRASAIVSPSARPRPSMVAAIRPGRPYGRTAVRIISHFVAPRASAASSFIWGVCANTSRDSAVMIGRTMIARTIEPSRIDFPYGPSLPKIGSPAEVLCAASRDSPMTGLTRIVAAPEAEHDARHGGEQVDHEAERRSATRFGA